MKVKDVFTGILNNVLGYIDDEVPKSEVIDTIEQIPESMLEELTNGKGGDEE